MRMIGGTGNCGLAVDRRGCLLPRHEHLRRGRDCRADVTARHCNPGISDARCSARASTPDIALPRSAFRAPAHGVLRRGNSSTASVWPASGRERAEAGFVAAARRGEPLAQTGRFPLTLVTPGRLFRTRGSISAIGLPRLRVGRIYESGVEECHSANPSRERACSISVQKRRRRHAGVSPLRRRSSSIVNARSAIVHPRSLAIGEVGTSQQEQLPNRGGGCRATRHGACR